MLLNRVKEKGVFTLELMVSLVISVFVLLLVLVLYANYEQLRVKTTSINKAYSNSYVGLNFLEKNAKQVGFGLNGVNFLGCNVSAYNTETAKGYSFPLMPVEINFASSNKESDNFYFLFGNASNYFAPIKITNDVIDDENLLLESRFGISLGDVFVVGNNRDDGCVLRQVSDLPEIGSSQIEYKNKMYGNEVVGYQNTKYNNDSAISPAPQNGFMFLNLGKDPKRQHYYVQNEKLMLNSMFDGEDDISTIMNNVVLMKAVYALDHNQDSSVDEWSTEVITPENANKIIGMRIGLAIKVPLKNAKCNETLDPELDWLGGVMDISNVEDYKCYNYKVLQTTVPFKNIIWKN